MVSVVVIGGSCLLCGHGTPAARRSSTIAGMGNPWTEIGDRVFVRRYAAFDQNIVAVLGRDEALVLDTRSTYPQAREILGDLRALGSPRVVAVVNSHGHFDHALGNRVFRPAPIWGHVRCAAMLDPATSTQLELAASELDPADAADLAEVELDPPDRVFSTRASVEVGGRVVDLEFLGRGHTDNDIVLAVPDADVLCAGDLLENGAPPYFGDGFPMDWPGTATAILARTGPSTVVVPGHGDHAGRSFVKASVAQLRSIAALARRVRGGALNLEAAVALAPYPADLAVEPLERALAQLRGDLG
jgi:glyoxylase-like metal-dependent hydrolase (beta-lactamase superfamily II)